MTTESDRTSVWRPGTTLEHMRERMRRTLADHVAIELTELGADSLTGTMPVDHRTCQPMRVLHGGASVVLAETLGSLAANAANRDITRRFVGQEVGDFVGQVVQHYVHFVGVERRAVQDEAQPDQLVERE